MRILVTGGAGFLGSHLCERLVGLDHEVICLDNLSTGRASNVSHLDRSPKFSLIEHDVADELPLEALGQLDEIYHLASPASPPAYQADPIATLRTNFQGTANILAFAQSQRARIVFSSTSEVYGDAQVHPQPEHYWGHVNPVGPRACYDEGKRAAEALCWAYATTHGTDVRIARVFNTYGPRMRADDGRVVTNLVTAALKGAPLTLYGDGSQSRSFCFVTDMVDGFLALMADGHDDAFGPTNLGNEHEVTVAELAKLVLRLTGSQGPVTSKPLPVDDPRQRRPDISRARERLGWEPHIPLEEGLAQVIAHLRRDP